MSISCAHDIWNINHQKNILVEILWIEFF